MDNNVWSREKIEKTEKYNSILIILIIISIILIFVFPPFILLTIVLIRYKSTIKKQKELRYEVDKGNELIRQGYNKVCKGFFINDKEHKLNILDKDYGFSQIIDCELIESTKNYSQTFGTTNAKNIKSITSTYSTLQTEVCTEIGVNITTKDFNNPRIMFNCKNKKRIYKNSKKYKEALDMAQNIISTLKIVISQNNEKYIETGNITKIEHKYITEENASIQIERLSKLHQDGILTDYEFEMKKKEILEKVNLNY